MSVQTISAGSRKVGTCPHGNPAGACPLCCGMGGGSGKTTFDRNTRRRPGEMTWNECFAMGLVLKHQREARELAQKQLEAQALLNKQNSILSTISSKLTELTRSIRNNISAIADSFKQNVIEALSKNIQNIANTIKNTVLDAADKLKNIVNDVKQKLIDISDKLAAIFGEIKNAAEKRLSDLFKNQLQKVIDLLSFITATVDEESEKEENDRYQKRIINYKKIYDRKLIKYKDTKDNKKNGKSKNKKDKEEAQEQE